jgi:Domain of unknown function (DUF4145)
MAWSEDFGYRDCGWCAVKDVAMVLRWSSPRVDQANRVVTSTGAAREWHALTCPRCGGVTLIETVPHTVPVIIQVVPDRPGARERIEHVPQGISRHFEQAGRAEAAGLNGAAAVELRRTLEGAAAHYEVTEKNLAASIGKLIEMGLVAAPFKRVLDHIRIVGNQGAHYTDEDVGNDELRRATRFTAQVLRNLFEIPGELEALDTPSPTDDDGTS